MTNRYWKIGMLMALLISGRVEASTTLLTSVAVDDDPSGPVPLILIDPTGPAQTPELTCGVCGRLVKPEATDDPTVAELLLAHEGGFTGDIEVVVWLDTDERASLWIPSVTIAEGAPVDLEVIAEDGWEWSDVVYGWTQSYAAQ